MRKFFDKAKSKLDSQKPMNTGGGDSGPAPPQPASNPGPGSNKGPPFPAPVENEIPHQDGTEPQHFDLKKSTAKRAVWPYPGQQPPGPGQMPPRVAKLDYTGKHLFFHPNGNRHDTLRDLGFSSVVDGKVVWSWGDTLMGTHDHNMICATDSTSIGDVDHPMTSMDTALYPNSDNVREWIPCTKDEEKHGGLGEHAYGGTNIIEYAPNKGIVFFLHNHRPGGQGKILGAGVATCHVDSNGVPQAQRVDSSPRMWTGEEPYWGDVGVALDTRDGHVYAYGHGPQDEAKEISTRTFLCRAPVEKATELKAYEYWNNQTREWTKQRLTLHGNDGTLKLEQDMAIFGWQAMNQSAPFWSNRFNRWMLLHTDSFPFGDVKCKTAEKLEGPWEDHGDVASTRPDGHPSREGFRYCAVGHPWADPSGKKVLVTWTNDNEIWGVWVNWQ